jgi:type I restriction enzyme S subunit
VTSERKQKKGIPHEECQQAAWSLGMASEWKTLSLAEVYDFSSGLSKPHSEFGSGHPFLSFKDVFYNSAVPKQLTELVQSTEQERARCSVMRGDVFLTRTSETMNELGMSSVALADIPDATFNGFTKRLRPKRKLVVPEFARYFFRSSEFCAAVNSMSTMSTRASLNNEMLERLTITFPECSVQKAIGHILGTLDDKIELNRKVNETLEAMARALFKSWFVDFDPVCAKAEGRDPGLPAHLAALFPDSFDDSELGEIPKGWQLMSLASVCENIFSGGTPSTAAHDYWGGNIPWLSSGETRAKFIISTEKFITLQGVEKSSTRIARAGATVIASAGQGNTRGQTSMLMFDAYINQSVVALLPNRLQSSDVHLFFDLERRYEEFRRISDGHSSRGSLTTKLLGGLTVVLPPIEIVREFDLLAEPIVQRITCALRESQALTALRDSLLPKLISGELRVPESAGLT